MVGLGRMGANMTTRLIAGGHWVIVYDRGADAVKQSAQRRRDRSEFAGRSRAKFTQSPRVIWLMIPPENLIPDRYYRRLMGCWPPATSSSTAEIRNYQDGLAAYERCQDQGISFVDAERAAASGDYRRLLPDGGRRFQPPSPIASRSS